MPNLQFVRLRTDTDLFAYLPIRLFALYFTFSYFYSKLPMKRGMEHASIIKLVKRIC